MDNERAPQYSRDEIVGALPSGWRQGSANGHGEWNGRRGRWHLTVRDGAGVVWPLEVRRADLERHGRLEALRRATHRLQRRSLG